MKMSDFLCSKAVTSDLKATTKEGVIQELVQLLIDAGVFEKSSKNKVIEILMAREALGSTAIGQGIAIPHGKSDCVEKLIGCLGISKQGVDFDSLDGEPAHIFFLLIAPIDSAGPHLKALARISRLLKDKFIRDSLKAAKDEKIMLKIIEQENARLSG
ncbi:MAG: PTS sugar transporter subunit IIA [Candidatus Omnitrophica bacterium]|nr:PTS sugar transporter subunit IIA [Candidatus Omnitrophota bacterium]